MKRPAYTDSKERQLYIAMAPDCRRVVVATATEDHAGFWRWHSNISYRAGSSKYSTVTLALAAAAKALGYALTDAPR